MIVETDFTTKRHTLVFEKHGFSTNKRIDLDESESRELDLWLEQKLVDIAAIDRRAEKER